MIVTAFTGGNYGPGYIGSTTTTTAWNGGICTRCGLHYAGYHVCSYMPVYVYPTTPRVDELIDEIKKLRKELKKARRDGADSTD